MSSPVAREVDPVDQGPGIVSGRIRQEAVVHDRERAGIPRVDPHAAPRRRLHHVDVEMGERAAGGTTWVVGDRRAHAHHRVEIPGVGRADRASGLEQGLGTVRLVGEVTPRSGKELRARSVHDLDPRMVEQVRPTPGTSAWTSIECRAKYLRRTDAASKQDRGGAVGARGQDHEAATIRAPRRRPGPSPPRPPRRRSAADPRSRRARS